MLSANDLLTRVESARLWSQFHKDWLLQIRQTLRDQLPGEYRVFVESDTVLIAPGTGDVAGTVLPDVAVARSELHAATVAARAGVATAAVIEADEPCELEVHYTLVIRRAPEQHVVAVVELLSPSNKGIGNRLDEQQHLRKRDEYLHAGVSLLEIDALLQGRRELPEPIAPLVDYARIAWTSSYEAGRRRYRGWGWNQDEPLPRIDWQIDPVQQVLVDLDRTLADAVAFNDWEQLVTTA
jgi:hypothetical protein